MLKDNLIFITFILLIIVFSYVVPKALIILATPFVYEPQTYNETVNIEISLFNREEKIVIRTNISDSDATDTPIDKVILNLTASNGTLIYENEEMTDTGLTCGTDCWIYEKNYTFIRNDPDGVWVIDVCANDTANNFDTNSTDFRLLSCIPTVLPKDWNLNCSENCKIIGKAYSDIGEIKIYNNGTYYCEDCNYTFEGLIFYSNATDCKLILKNINWVM